MNLKKLTIAIVTHVYTTGPAFRLESYLKNKVSTLVFIGHPFLYAKDTRSFLRIYNRGELIIEKKFIKINGPEIVFYFRDFFLTLWWIILYTKKVDLLIAADNLNAFSAHWLRYIGKVRKYVFYTIDYVPHRFPNEILNALYHFLDRFAVRNSNTVWNLSPVMVEEREKRGVEKKYKRKQLVVPIGTDYSSKIMSINKIDRYKIVHMGHLLPKQGVELLIQAIPEVIKRVPQAHLLIIGGGPSEEKLKRDVSRLKLTGHIRFTGFIEKFSDVRKYLQDAAIAVAPYVDDENTYTRYTDPGKPKDYLSSGIPVIITKVPQVAYEIEKNKCGIAISYNKEDMVGALVKLLTDNKLYRQYRHNTRKMVKRYLWNQIFKEALRNTL